MSEALDPSKLNLLPHQENGVATCNAYLTSKATGSALINHPTGSGKTGIMAVVASLHKKDKPVLIVCPSDALTKQIIEDLQRGFWTAIGAPRDWRLDSVDRLYLNNAETVAKKLSGKYAPHAVVGTIQALVQILKRPVYSKFKKKFSAVFFDEGHREPAPLWAQAVRGLQSPTILFSATPYRNDFKLFHIDPTFINYLSFEEAAETGFIRSVTVVEEELPESVDGFAKAVIAKRDALIASRRMKASDKVIIRAATEEEVSGLFYAFKRALSKRSEGVLAVHDQFKDDEGDGYYFGKTVPEKLKERGERFLIHQFKLTEGIDDSACRLLALFSRFSNERQLVQQVGRLTRHPGPFGDIAKPAVVLARKGEGVSDSWNRFLDYDRACRIKQTPPIRDGAFFARLLEILPENEYIAGKFRQQPEFNTTEFLDDLIVPLSAVIYDIADSFEYDKFCEEIDRALEIEDRDIVHEGQIPDGRDMAIRVSVKLTQSPFLSRSIFQSPTLEVTLIMRTGNRLFFYDSAGLNIDEHKALKDRLSPRAVASLLADDAETKVSSLTLKNTDLSPLAVRGRSMRAVNLERSGIFMGEQSHVATLASGYKGPHRRALNLSRGRLREREGVYQTLVEYADWCEHVDDELNAQPVPSSLFNRFAAQIPAPADTTPKNILLDLWSFKDEFVDADKGVVEFDFEGVCVDVKPAVGEKANADFPFFFELKLKSRVIDVWLKYDTKKRKFWVHSPGLSAIKNKREERKTLAAKINQQQPFRIIIDAQTVFAYGHFYSVTLDLRRSDGPGSTVLGMLRAIDELQDIATEKGTLQGDAKTWPKNSLFRLIDDEITADRSEAFGAVFDAVVCDDFGSEVGDFVGYREGDVEPGCVAMIAAKWKSGTPGAGASNLYDVVAQTLKNLGFLKGDGNPLPGKTAKFDEDWTHNGGSVSRLRKGPPSKEFRKTFADVRARPSTRREAWLVLGGGILSQSKVEATFRKNNPAAHTLQLFHLLLSLYATCQSVGVEPKIYCAK